ncbi:predicted protein [Lichtheimia corymbifera JMRC:FSU:9682]|uniref:BZIP domain-containing protein n=1 Tax=Lichtheimia corymbifera JMRC:FSU:9682 TaxID=1263082 RepID=A0A068SI90_9FUNG|nr:predicted protein [Lichtheimia corymbifera JMRC:FSU:9682]
MTTATNDWNIDDTAHDLLNEAIASNYRSQRLDEPLSLSNEESTHKTTTKRKSSRTTNESLSSASSGEKRGLDKTDDAESRSKSAPKRAGRKPLEKTQPSDAPLDPKQKRKEQNRAAQRAFRERKERHVQELQDRIRELEEENAAHGTLVKENEKLKEQIKKLKEENYALKGTPFTFEYPPKTISHEEEYRSSSGNSSSNSSCGSLSVGGEKMTGSSNSSINSGESPALASDTSPEVEEHTPQDLGASVQSFNIEDIFFPSSNHDMNFFNPTSSADMTTNATINVVDNSNLTDHAAANVTPATTTATTTTTNFSDTTKNDLIFTDYRIPPSSDNFLFQNDLPPLFGEEFDLFGLTAPAPYTNNEMDPSLFTNQQSILQQTPMLQQQQQQQQQPQQQQQQAPPTHQPCDLGPLVQTLQQDKYGQPKATEIDQRLKDYCPDFDLENLCVQLKEKAKCTETVLTPKEMSNIITYVEHKHHEKQSL